MNQRRVQIVLLCEDRQQEVFARHFLKKRGFTGNIRANFCLKGAGEQFVRDSYAAEVKAYRSKNYLSVILVVLIDADKETIEKRLKQLDDALIADSQQIRQPQEAIAIFIPKRNIETWIHYLQGEAVDEETEYSKFTKNESACKPYVESLVNQCYQGLDANAPSSLQAACGELKRILPLLE
ncbi:hypothetical protein NIES37_36310 [Tolypothrix tenuis PCC 7101]|uniref:DUF4276 domain-containing protein n=1 Tax=Tolypothrix tenuis PCC 7101 TaxID=231146 RepID=A0A1Z4N1M3_9CYAN|nr:hypothetical protein [Aulosira sp. FACHB-113]BAY99648.1 hypothetical protein NIES37_36310 [Tolypothrix tenuis PCC 7101]BAZ76430.1 hypothetical protein NIES50_50280 [Aulosira laxa NIES-50]